MCNNTDSPHDRCGHRRDKHCHGGHHHGDAKHRSRFHNLFDENRADMNSQFSCAAVTVRDNELVAEARKRLSLAKDSAQAHVELGDELCFQLRYKEAIECYLSALSLQPDNYTALRKLAVRYLTTLQFDKAEELFLRCDAISKDKLDTTYRLGLLAFYKHDFARAETLMEKCLPLCFDNGEMYIAVLYWLLLARLRQFKDISETLKLFSPDTEYGHHVGYYMIFSSLTGEEDMDATCEKAMSDDALTAAIVLYAAYNCALYEGNAEKADAMLNKAVAANDYWASFAYIAAYTDKYGAKK